MSSKYRLVIIYVAISALAIFIPGYTIAQSVGISPDGSAPDPSAILDVRSTDQGMLIPRMDSTARLNITSPAIGLMVFDTSTMGLWFYGTSGWISFSDSDWFKENTTDTPTSIYDDMYHMGYVGIGKSNPISALDIEGNDLSILNVTNTINSDFSAIGAYIEMGSGGSGSRSGTYNYLSGSGSGSQYGILNSIPNSGHGYHYGVFNSLSGNGDGLQIGVDNLVFGSGDGDHIGYRSSLSSSGDGQQIGLYNKIGNTGNNNHYGVKNELTGSNDGDHYGTYTSLSGSGGGEQYGQYNLISNSGYLNHYGVKNELTGPNNGFHYGVYSNVNGSGNNYGTYNRVTGSTSFTQFGTYNEVIGVQNAGGLKGVYNKINGVAFASKYGIQNIIVDNGNAVGYGTYNEFQGDGTGNWFGVYNYLPNTGSGVHTAGYFNAPGATNYAAIFQAGNVVVNEGSGDYDFRVESNNNANQFFVDGATGYVGIGTNIPSSSLEITGADDTDAIEFDNGKAQLRNHYDFISTDRDFMFFLLDADGNQTNAIWALYKDVWASGANVPAVKFGLENQQSWFNGGGNFGFNNTNPLFPLHMGSGAHVTAAGVWTNASDRAKKKEIVPLTYGLQTVMQMQPKHYLYNVDNSPSIGFIAQDMEQIIPEAVSGEEGNKGIAYGLLTSVLVNAIQEQQKMLDDKQSQIDALEKRLAALEAYMSSKE